MPLLSIRFPIPGFSSFRVFLAPFASLSFAFTASSNGSSGDGFLKSIGRGFPVFFLSPAVAVPPTEFQLNLLAGTTCHQRAEHSSVGCLRSISEYCRQWNSALNGLSLQRRGKTLRPLAEFEVTYLVPSYANRAAFRKFLARAKKAPPQ